jgi:hypothetical protein
MKYEGKLFGQVAGSYFPLHETTEDYEKIKKENEILKEKCKHLHDTRHLQTIIIDDIELSVSYKYIPEEPMVMYYPDGSGHPGSAAELVEVTVYYKGVDVTDIYEDRMDEVESQIWNLIESYED